MSQNTDSARSAHREAPNRRIVIIGGGFSGTMVAANCLRSADSALEIVLIEPRPNAGHGLAYSTGEARHLLNVPCAKMGAWPDDVTGFHRWVEERRGSTDPGAFLPRSEYGRYVESELDRAAREARADVTLSRVRTRVHALALTARGFRAHLENGAAVDADAAVLALGSGPPRTPEPVRSLTTSRPDLVVLPFEPGGLARIGTSEHILVLGTGLTMLDVLVSLLHRGFTGTVHALSRRGLRPAVHRPYQAPSWVTAWAESLQSVPDLRLLCRALRDMAERATSEGSDWRSVIDALRPHTPRIWQRLEDRDRARFLRHLSAHWDIHRHRCAAEIADAIEPLAQQRRLTMSAGVVAACQTSGSGVDVEIRPRGCGPVLRSQFDRVVVCAGPESDVTRWEMPLMAGLLRSGLVMPCPHRLGIRTSPAGESLRSDGRAVAGLFVAGPLRKADLWEGTAVPELRAHAADLAARLLAHPGRTHPSHEPVVKPVVGRSR